MQPTPDDDNSTLPDIDLSHKDRLLIGISLYDDVLTDEIDEKLERRYTASTNKCCEFCGVSITNEMRKPLFLNNRWFNACSMCYYTSNLDQIDFPQAGEIVYFSHMKQPRFNAMLRTFWCVNYLAGLDPDNDELISYSQSIETLSATLEAQKNITKGYFLTTDTAVYASHMGLMKEQDYNQRHKLFKSFVWLPDPESFDSEIAFWAEQDYSHLHPEKTAGNIKQYMTRYMPNFSLKD